MAEKTFFELEVLQLGNACCLIGNACCIISIMSEPEKRRQSLFGTRAQTKVTMLICLLGETYPRELARLSGSTTGSISRFLDRSETEGIIVSRYQGTERKISLNPRFVAKKELITLVERLILAEPELMESVRSLRKRPRRRGKEI